MAIYLAELCCSASTCQWSEAALGKNLPDKFAMGLCNECILQQLLTQDHSKSLDDLFQLATTFEATESKALRRSEGKSQTIVASISNGKNPKSKSRAEPPRKRIQQPTQDSFIKNRLITIAPVVGEIIPRNHVNFTVKSVHISVEKLAICDCLWENQSYRPFKSIEKRRF